MHHPSSDDLISVREAARRLSINQSTLSRQVGLGLIRAHGGKVRLSEVEEDRSNNVDLTRSRRKRPADASGSDGGASPDASARASTKDRATPKASADAARSDTPPTEPTFEVDGEIISFPKAKAQKEASLAQLRQLEYAQKAGRLINLAEAEKVFFQTARGFRDAWLAWPARVAVVMASELSVDPRALTTVLTAYVQQHLDELGDPSADFGQG